MYENITEFSRNIGNALFGANVDHYFSVGIEIIFLSTALMKEIRYVCIYSANSSKTTKFGIQNANVSDSHT